MRALRGSLKLGLAMSLALLMACSGRKCDSGYYEGLDDMSADSGGQSDMPDLPDLGPSPACVEDKDCAFRQNTTVSCVEQSCVYSCKPSWGDPMDERAQLGCLCDKTKGSCLLEPVCGDGFKEGDEQCDDGLMNSDELPNACRTSCKSAACGDKVVDTGELCDDGDDDDSDECTSACTACGNGQLDVGEECDDGQVPPKDHDGCSSTCLLEPYWGCSETLPSTCWQELADPDAINVSPFESTSIVGFSNMAATSIDLFVGLPCLGETSEDCSGRVTVFTQDPTTKVWSWSHRLKASDSAPEARFGHSLVTDGAGWLFVGSPSRAVAGNAYAGQVYVFRRIGGEWKETQRLVSPEFVSNEYFGYYMAFCNDVLYVGQDSGGVVHSFEYNGLDWQHVNKISLSEANVTNFGVRLTCSETHDGFWATNHYCSDARGLSGCIHRYDKDDDEVTTLYSPAYMNGQSNNYFGRKMFSSKYGFFVEGDRVNDVYRGYFLDDSLNVLQTFSSDNGIVSYAVGEHLLVLNGLSLDVYKYIQGFWNKGGGVISIDSPKIVDSDFGYAFTRNETTLFIGAPRYSSTYQGSGAIFIYDLNKLP